MAIKKTTTFSESNINTNNNTSSLSIKIYFSANNNLTWFESATLSCTCNGVTKTKTVSHPIGGSVSTTFTFTNIAHNNDGTKSVNWSWRCPTGTSTLGTMTDSGTKSLTKINRQATMTNASNFNDEQNPQVWFNNPGNFWLQMKIEAGGNTSLIVRSESVVKNASSPYTWQLTETERNTLRNLSKNSATLPVRFTIGTNINGSIANWSYLDRTMTMVNANPIFSDFEYEDINTSTIAITDDNSKIVLGYSTLRVSIDSTNKAEAQKYATMKYYLINNIQYPYEENFSVDIPNWNSETITVTAVDSRGFSTAVSKNLTIATYVPLQKGNIELARDGNISEETTLKYSGTITKTLPNGSLNTIIATYQYKKTTEQNYTTGTTNITPTIDNEGNFSFDDYITGDIATGFSIDDSFNIIVTVSDVLSTIQYTYTLNSGIPAIAVKGNKVAFHGSYDENEGGDVQINGKNIIDFIHPVGSIYMSMNVTSPSILFGGTWERIGVGRVLVSAGRDSEAVADTNTYTGRGESNIAATSFPVGEKGGETDHTLTVAQLPSHRHTVGTNKDIGGMTPSSVSRRQVGSSGTNRGYAFTTDSTSSNSALSFHNGTDHTGGDNSHNIMQPYLAVYMWQRIA